MPQKNIFYAPGDRDNTAPMSESAIKVNKTSKGKSAKDIPPKGVGVFPSSLISFPTRTAFSFAFQLLAEGFRERTSGRLKRLALSESLSSRRTLVPFVPVNLNSSVTTPLLPLLFFHFSTVLDVSAMPLPVQLQLAPARMLRIAAHSFFDGSPTVR